MKGAARVQKRATEAKRGSLLRHERNAAYVLILPNVLGFLVFTLGPLLFSLVLSFYEWDMLRPMQLVGPKNYQKLLFRDPRFRQVLRNTVLYVGLAVPLRTVLALTLAVALNQGLRGTTFYRAAFYMPTVTSLVAVSLVWRWIFNPEYGIINYGLTSIGIANPPMWLLSRTWAMPAIAIMTIWYRAGYFMVIFLAGLQGIPEHLYDAAKVDGASAWGRFRHVTLPMLSPTTFFVIVMSVIASFQIFTISLIMTEGGPAGATETIMLYLYRTGFEYFRMGYASAVAWVFCLMIFALTFLQTRLQKSWVYAE